MIWQAALKPLVAVTLFCASSQAAVPLPRQGDPEACPRYKASNVKSDGGAILSADLNLTEAPCNVYGTDLANFSILVEYQSPERLHVKIYDADEQVYQIPESVLPRPRTDKAMSSSKSDLELSMNHNPFSFSSTRNSTGENLFDTTAHPIGFLSQYLSICTKLPESLNIYGLGESFDPFRLKTSNYSKTLWSRDAYGTPRFTTCTATTPYILTTVGKTPSMVSSWPIAAARMLSMMTLTGSIWSIAPLVA
ncbi:hypothetical protein PEBR_33633 [Penicillium brasilianum]|uniref:Glycoside hydrolase family 31 N-terminal domain-containing protein n=1 Tax=Penicillium brasilianum TaxID=104259 RepID=A0A1S9RFZ5_PENBI|nr:hypothetical protein PEBR_33633 [Penicillium brasilianum]